MDFFPLPANSSRSSDSCSRDIIARSGLFDPSYYLKENPDVASAGVNPLDHFCKDGWREGRQPNLFFDPIWYVATQHRTTNDENPLAHYIRAGEAAGLRPAEAFDPAWFRSVADVPPEASPLAMLLEHRAAQGVASDEHSDLSFWDDRVVIALSGLFDSNYYLIANPDVREVGRDAIFHFHAHGWREGRRPNPYFDPLWYAARYLSAGSAENPLAHYARSGEPNGFRPSCLFDPAWYRVAYNIASDQLALAHYLEHRRSQSVAPNPNFDITFYLSRHGADIGPNRDPFMHLMRWGATLDLDPSATFDSATYREREMADGDGTQVPFVHYLEASMREPDEEATKKRRQSICLCMIVKDEAPVIRRCLESVLPLIDAWLIVDTGSSDDTREIVRAALASLPGALHERPWQDFAHNRTEALALARPCADYSLIIDADDQLIVPQSFPCLELTEDAYAVDIADSGVVYARTQFVSNRLTWRYEGVLHEYLVCEAARPAGHLPIVMRRNHDGARRRNPETYRNDAAVLERTLAEEPDPFKRARYTFYLAQSYRDCGEAVKAIDCYLARASMGFWNEEVYVSLLAAGRVMEMLGWPRPNTLAIYARATATCPGRIEAAHAAGRLCRLNDDFAAGYEATIGVLGCPMPRGGLFLEPWIYAYGLADEVAVNAYWSGHFHEATDASLRALESAELPPGERPRLLKNLRFALDRLQAARGASAPSVAEAASGWAPENPNGGTELIVDALRARLGDSLAQIDLRINFYDPATRNGRPLVVWFHHDIDQTAVQWCRDSALVAPVATFVFISHWQRERFVSAFNLTPERCIVIRYAMDQEADPRRWKSTPVLRCAYTSTPFRGLDVLLDAWEMLAPKSAELHIWSSMKLYVADDGPYRHLFERAQTMPGVIYYGLAPNPELRTALRTMHFLTYPNTFAETACLSVMEAMAAGCRVIVPAFGALPETTGGYARLYTASVEHGRHVATFAEALGEELASPWRGRPDNALAQQTHCATVFAWSRCLEEWLELIARLVQRIDERPAPPRIGAPAAITTRPSDRIGDAL